MGTLYVNYISKSYLKCQFKKSVMLELFITLDFSKSKPLITKICLLLSPNLISFPYIKPSAYFTINTTSSERKKVLLKLNCVFKTDFSLICLIWGICMCITHTFHHLCPQVSRPISSRWHV